MKPFFQIVRSGHVLRTLSTALCWKTTNTFCILVLGWETYSGKLYSRNLATSSLYKFISSLHRLSLCDTVYHTVQGGSTFWVYGRNPKVKPFKWKLLSSTVLWCLLFFIASQDQTRKKIEFLFWAFLSLKKYRMLMMIVVTTTTNF